jgi:hypothetical protein
MELDSPLGAYADREEYQVERVIVNIQIPVHGSRQMWLERGRRLFPDAWRAIPSVIDAAERASRDELPTSWQHIDLQAESVRPLVVYGMWIEPATEKVTYRVGLNFEFDFENRSDFPEDYFVSVERDTEGNLRAFGDMS